MPLTDAPGRHAPEPAHDAVGHKLPPAAVAEMLSNRCRKNLRSLAKWRRRPGPDGGAETEAFRVYDRDIPELPFAID